MNTKAGWAQIEITPPLGLPMGGRGPRFTPGAVVLDPLMAQALALQDGNGSRTLWLSLDLIGLGSGLAESLLYDLAAMTGVPYEAIVVNTAHPHSGPMINFVKYPTIIPKPEALTAYEADVRRKLVRVAYEAVQKLAPATVTLHHGGSDVGVNRRNRNAAGEMTMAPNAAGVYNRDLWVFDVVADDKRCVVFNYGCHPVIVYGFAWDGISADYPGACRRKLRAQLGDDVQAQFIQGLAGNVRPRVLADPEAGRFRKSTPDDLERASTQLSADVLAALALDGEPLDLDLAAAGGWFLARRDPAQIPPLEHWQALAEREDELERNVGRYWAERLEAGLPPVQAVPWQLGLIRLSREHTIAWLSGEAVAEWQGHLRRWLDDERLIVWGYCQQVPAYLPTDELLPEGGYEVVQSNLYSNTGPGPFAPGLNEAVRARMAALRRQIAP